MPCRWTRGATVLFINPRLVMVDKSLWRCSRVDRIESVVLYSFGWERTYCGWSWRDETCANHFGSWRISAFACRGSIFYWYRLQCLLERCNVLFIYFISFQVVRKPYVLLYRQEGDPVSELFQKYNLSDLKLKTLVPLSYPWFWLITGWTVSDQLETF